MNYYEELGVSPQATEQEIRKAHRRLVKLMHPDAQPDQRLKLEAETKMRHLNSMVSTLLDPEQRRSYDDQLRASSDSMQKSGAVSTNFGGIPWWMASAVAAIFLTLAAVWLWADHMANNSGKKSSRAAVYLAADDHPAVTVQTPASTVISDLSPNQKPPLKSEPLPKPSLAAANQPAVVTQKPLAPSAVTRPDVRETAPPKPSARSTKPKTTEAKHLTARNAPPDRKQFQVPDGSVMASAGSARGGDGSQLPAPPGVPASPLSAAEPPSRVSTDAGATNSATGASRDPLEGEWVYAPKEPERRRPGFYPPEFITLKLVGSGDPGSLRGQYSAKYVVTDRPVASEVNFQLASVSKGSRKFVWQGSNGAKGTLSIDPIDDRTIRIDWHTTSAMREPALTSGQATLVRK